MDAEMETSPSSFDPDNFSSQEQYRRYRKRQSSLNISPIHGSSESKFREEGSFFDGISNSSIQRPFNAALFLEGIKQEVENHKFDDSAFRAPYSSRRKTLDFELNIPLKSVKHEDEVLMDGGELSFSFFASLFDSALQGTWNLLDGELVAS